MSVKKVVLIDYRETGSVILQNQPFKVEHLTNTIEFKIGEYLTEARVKDLCEITGYQVIIKKPKK